MIVVSEDIGLTDTENILITTISDQEVNFS